MKEPLQQWVNANKLDDNLIWKDSSSAQILFARDHLGGLFGAGLPYDQRRDEMCFVVSTHTSKSCLLPVYSFERAGLRLIARNNFFNWKFSVISEAPIEADFSGLFATTPPIDPKYTGNPLAPVYFEGFPEELIFGYYADSDKRHWSAEIQSHYGAWATLFLIMRALGHINPYKWSKRGDPV